MKRSLYLLSCRANYATDVNCMVNKAITLEVWILLNEPATVDGFRRMFDVVLDRFPQIRSTTTPQLCAELSYDLLNHPQFNKVDNNLDLHDDFWITIENRETESYLEPYGFRHLVQVVFWSNRGFWDELSKHKPEALEGIRDVLLTIILGLDAFFAIVGGQVEFDCGDYRERISGTEVDYLGKVLSRDGADWSGFYFDDRLVESIGIDHLRSWGRSLTPVEGGGFFLQRHKILYKEWSVSRDWWEETEEDMVAFAKEPDEDRLPYLVIPDSRGRVRSWHMLRRWPYWSRFIALVSGTTPVEYLEYLGDRNIDHVRAGEDHVDLRTALEELHDRYDVKVVRTDSGGTLNGILLREGLVDELSVLLNASLVGDVDTTPFMRAPPGWSKEHQVNLKLAFVEELDDNTVWLRYDVVR